MNMDTETTINEPNETSGLTGEKRFSTQQWVPYDVYDALIRTARTRPDFCAIITKMTEADGLVYVKLTFRTPGKITFVQRLTSFIVVAMREYYIRPMHQSNISS